MDKDRQATAFRIRILPREASSRQRRLAAVAGLVAAIALATGAADADQWYFQPKARLQGFYDDNVRLAVRPQSSYGAILRADALVGRRSEVTDVNLDGALVRNQYFDLPQLNNTEGYLTFDAKHRTERNLFHLSADFADESTLTSELLTTGRVQVNARRRTLTISPSWTRLLSERSKLTLGANYLDATYENAGLTGLSPYTYGTVSLQHTYNLTELTQLLWNLSYDRYTTERLNTESNSYGLMAGIGHSFSETLTASFLAGLRQSKGSFQILGNKIDESSSGPIFQASLTKTFETGSININASQTLLPSGEGLLLDSKQVAAVLNYRLSPRWALRLRALALHNTAPSAFTNRQDRKFVSIAPALEYNLTPWWRIGASYRYRRQKFADNPNGAASNAVFINLVYIWPTEPVPGWRSFK